MDAVKAYRKRRDQRLKSRMDAEDEGRWVTTEKKHKVHLNEGGEPDKGNPHVIRAMRGGSKKEKTKLEKEADKFHKELGSWKDVDFPEDKSEAVSVEDFEKKKMKDKLDRFSRLMHEEDPETMEDDMAKQGYKKNKEGRWEKEPNKTYSYGVGGDERKIESYESFPTSFRVGGRKYASAEDVKKVKATVSRFMNEARNGDVYEVGGGIGSAGGSRFQVTERSGKPYIVWIDSDGRRKSNPVQMSRSNVEKFISNGAKKVK